LKGGELDTAPIGEARLTRWLRRKQEAVSQERKLARIALETGSSVRQEAGASAAGDPQKLRGIPAIGYGVGGAMNDTQPERTTIARETRRERTRDRLGE
jgi:hypothetical protein